MEYLYLSIYLPIRQTLDRDLDCHGSTTKKGKDKRIKDRKCTGCIVEKKTQVKYAIVQIANEIDLNLINRLVHLCDMLTV